MPILFEQDIREKTVLEVAKKMMVSARTAPKARGVDNLEIALLGKNEIKKVSDKLKKMVKQDGVPEFFLRDSINILSADAMIAIGTKISPLELSYCGMCGFANCDEKKTHPEHPCIFNTGDLGIAIGSAVSVAMDNRVDSRVMYTTGLAIIKLGMLGKEVKIAYGIPLSVSAKNPFFDRDNEKLLGKK